MVGVAGGKVCDGGLASGGVFMMGRKVEDSCVRLARWRREGMVAGW